MFGDLCIRRIVLMGNCMFGKLWVDELCACSIVCLENCGSIYCLFGELC